MTRYLSLAEYLWLAEQVTGIDASVLVKASRVDLADSALHAPQAGFGDEDFYPDLFDKAAVLTCRLAWNHPLPDGNKRAAWAALVMFVDLNDGRWSPIHPAWMTLKRQCSQSRQARSTRPGSRTGFENACASTDRARTARGGSKNSYGMCSPEMLQATTSRWISFAPSKIV